MCVYMTINAAVENYWSPSSIIIRIRNKTIEERRMYFVDLFFDVYLKNFECNVPWEFPLKSWEYSNTNIIISIYARETFDQIVHFQ